jgi:uncharacterized protein YecE (DUF72 family)
MTQTCHTIHIGTSGWHYDHWQGTFYPEDMGSDAWLSYYTDHFQTVEINNTFYQLPSEKTFTQWRDSVPDAFLFAVKANRYITHMKKLKDPQEALDNFMRGASRLGPKLGPILFQLPPRWHCDVERLSSFVARLPPDLQYTFEFRDPTWFQDAVYDVLAEHNIAFCLYEIAGRVSPKHVTADFVYVRLHGPTDQAYQGQYSAETLDMWAKSFNTWRAEGKTVYCYFDNDEAGYAPQDAQRLRAMCTKNLSS